MIKAVIVPFPLTITFNILRKLLSGEVKFVSEARKFEDLKLQTKDSSSPNKIGRVLDFEANPSPTTVPKENSQISPSPISTPSIAGRRNFSMPRKLSFNAPTNQTNPRTPLNMVTPTPPRSRNPSQNEITIGLHNQAAPHKIALQPHLGDFDDHPESPLKESSVEPISSQQLQADNSDNKSDQTDNHGNNQNAPTSEPAGQRSSKCVTVRVWIGRCLLVALTVLSLYSIFALSLGGTDHSSWPWGFWYAVSLAIDQFVYQPMLTFLQYGLVYLYFIKQPPKSMKTVKCLTKLIIGKDIMRVFKSKLFLAKI